MRWWRSLPALLAATVTAATLTGTGTAPAGATEAMPECALPGAGAATTSASPAAEGFDPAKLARAMDFAQSRLRLNVQVHRNNCLVAAGRLNPLTGGVPWNIWSSTKSVVALVAGIARDQGRLDLAAPIGRYLPAGVGDAAHRAITVRDLLTQTSGLKQAIVSDVGASVAGADTDVVGQAMALPITHAPGTYFEYSQRGPDLLAYVVERAVGEDFQAFAQRNLFDPIGIGSHDHVWLRDRAGHTYGFANLYLPPDDLARLGLLLVNGGSWNDRRVVSSSYLDQLRAPSATNACYGYLVWVNHAPCVGPSLPSRKVYPAVPLAALPSDAYAMVGFLQQNNFVVPSLNLVVTWTGVLGDVSLDPQTLISASPDSELYHEFLRLLGQSFVRPRLPDPGPYRQNFNFDIQPGQFLDPAVTLGSLAIGPDAPAGCTPMACGGTLLPHQGTVQNLNAVLGLVTH
ncbi:serine hydrolase domain-containing protein [Amycolatopsis silviterrae]|uniref:Serine hydrolase domain-containing protein n=1 Tax=Amycolatopsis silviterrae TaxID=1656914 RepID=A0ABW5HGT9_9PSEU